MPRCIRVAVCIGRVTGGEAAHYLRITTEWLRRKTLTGLMGLPLQMSSHTQALAIPQQSLSIASALWRDAALVAHLATMAAAAMAIGFGYFSLEMARWGMSVVVDAARSFAE